MDETVENLTSQDRPTGDDSITSGIASPDLLRALESASSADTQPEGNQSGDTSDQSGNGTPESTAGARTQPDPNAPVAPGQATTDRTPQTRIEQAVKNAREETRREVEAQYAPFKGLNVEEVQLGIQLLRELREDSGKFFAELQQQLQGQGQLPVIEETDEAYPEPDLVSRDGQVKTYSHATFQKALEIHGRKVKAEMMKGINPYINYVKDAQTRDEQHQQLEERRRVVSSALEEARQLPHFTKENEPKILEIMKGIPAERRASLGPVATLNMAYNMFLRDHIFPTIDSDAEKRVRESYQKKARTSAGSVHPVTPGGDGRKPVLKNQNDLAAHMENLAAQMAD